ncbi:unnamed protein product, partial [marine sediment metagenome]
MHIPEAIIWLEYRLEYRLEYQLEYRLECYRNNAGTTLERRQGFARHLPGKRHRKA